VLFRSLDNVPRDVFYPPPKVDSAIVRLKPRKLPFPVENEKIFFNLVKIMFSQRNRKVRNGVTLFLREQNIEENGARKMADSIFLKDKRVRELTLEDFGAITNELLRKEPYLR
jgi:16S rRNA (adenine1518-N6/adenine1519-N6)-dimethyltransferase